MDGPLVFPPRPEARRASLFMVAFFAFFILMGWSLPLIGGEKGRGFFLFMAAICTLCFGGFLGMVLVALRETRDPVTLDDAGLSAAGRRLAWTEIASAEAQSRPEPMVVVRPRAGAPLRLRTAAYADGPEMGRLVQARVVRPAVLASETKTYRPTGLGLTAFALGVALVMAVGLGLFQLRVPAPPKALVHPAVVQLGLLAPLLLGLAASALTRYVRLDGRELTVGSLFGRKTVPLALVDAVEDGETGVVARSGSRRLLVSKGYAGYPEIRERLLALAPKGTQAAPAPPSTLREPTIFEPKPWAWAGPLVMGLFILSFGLPGVVVGVVTATTRLGAGLFLATISLVPTLLGFTALAYAVEARAAYVLDAEGVERRAVFRPRRVRWSEIEAAWRTGTMLAGFRLETSDGVLDVSPEFLKDGPGLVAMIEARTAEARARAVRSAEGERFGPGGEWVTMSGFLGLVGLAMAVGSVPAFGGAMGRGRPGDAEAGVLMGALLLGMGLGLIAMALWTLTTRYVVRPEGLEVATLRGRRRVPWSEITRAETGVQQGKSSRIALTLEHPQGTVRINTTMTRDFDRLRGAVLARVRPEVVRESL